MLLMFEGAAETGQIKKADFKSWVVSFIFEQSCSIDRKSLTKLTFRVQFGHPFRMLISL